MTTSTCTITCIALHRRSVKAPMAAMPRARMAPHTRAVSGVTSHGQTRIARSGTRKQKALVSAARTPTEPISRLTPERHEQVVRGGGRVVPAVRPPDGEDQEGRCEVEADPEPERDVAVLELAPVQQRGDAHQGRKRCH